MSQAKDHVVAHLHSLLHKADSQKKHLDCKRHELNEAKKAYRKAAKAAAIALAVFDSKVLQSE